MRIFVAGASGIIGQHLVPLLVADGHTVGGMTRSEAGAELLRSLGAEPFVCDVYDTEQLRAVVVEFAPEVVINQLTDLPDHTSDLAEFGPKNARIRREGVANLLRAAAAAGASRFLAQSVAWDLSGDSAVASADLEAAVLAAEGVVIRYGQLYGPGTYYEDREAPAPRIHVADAARRTVPLLSAPSGVVVLVDGGGGG